MAASPHVVDVTDETFPQLVVEASRTRPVVVDFWAPWCAPCRALGPVLERLADEGGGAWTLAKINTEAHNQEASRLGVRGIPAVKAFRGGELISEFTGALPEAQIRTWLENVVPSSGRRRAEEAAVLLFKGHPDDADRIAEEVLEAEPRQALALLLRAKIALGETRLDDAEAWLAQIGEARELTADVTQTKARLVVAKAAREAGDEPALRQRLESDATDHVAAVGLAAYQALDGDLEAAFGALCRTLGAAPASKPAAHPLALAILELVDPEARAGLRRKLSMVLF